MIENYRIIKSNESDNFLSPKFSDKLKWMGQKKNIYNVRRLDNFHKKNIWKAVIASSP